MLCENVVISVRGLSKQYRLFDHPGDRVKQFISFGLKRYHRQFTALNDISMDIHKGETVGIIGRNGSGKSTLLQCICGILKPNDGTVTVNGRISALLELGSGFNPEFTGRENVYFQGTLMGLSREQVDQRFDQIASFAGIDEFIDQPVRTYSSGMFVRLAFAVAVGVDPDILVVDEALAVGDAEFQAKCFGRIDEIRNRGGTILIVSHALEQVAHYCDRVVLLDCGELLADGDAAATLNMYLELSRPGAMHIAAATESSPPDKNTSSGFTRHPDYQPVEKRWGDRQATIEGIQIVQGGCVDPEFLIPGLVAEIRLKIYFHAEIEHPLFGLTVKRIDGLKLLAVNSRELGDAAACRPKVPGEQLTVCFKFDPYLDHGRYTLSVGVAGDRAGEIIPHDRRYDAILIRIANPRTSAGEPALNPSFELCDGF